MPTTPAFMSWGLAYGLLPVTAAALTAPGTTDPYPEPSGPFYSLAENGQTRCCIVVPGGASPARDHAAKELQTYLGRITGAPPAIVRSPQPGVYPIELGIAGRSREPDRLEGTGFLLKSSNTGLIVSAPSGLDVLLGVYHFLEKHCGARWFLPGEIGEVVPHDPSLKIGTFDETCLPSFPIRWIDNGDWALHNKMNVGVKVGDQTVGVNWKWGFHTHFYLIRPETHYDGHPEWFAMNTAGKRPRPKPKRQGQQLCTANPDLVREMARSVCKLFDEQPDIDILSLAPQDGGGFCLCDACRALDEKRLPEEAWHARYSNRLAVFNNEVAKLVAKEHPDKLIKVGAYAMYLRVPRDADFRPEPNLAVQVCHTYSCNNHPIESETCNGNTKYFREELEHWARLTDHLFMYEYYNKGAMGALPYWQLHVMRHDMPYYHRLGVESFYTQPSGGHVYCALNHYIAMKLSWDVTLSVDKLLDDFCGKFFGPAAKPMRTYFDTLEQAYVDWGQDLSPFGLRWVTLVAPEIFAPAVLAGMEHAMGEAEAAAKSDVTHRRLRLFKLNLEYTRRTVGYLRAVRKPFEAVDLSDKEAVAAAQRQAKEVGTPLAAGIKAFCRENGLPYPGRRIEVHSKGLQYIIGVPGRKPILM